MKKRWIILIALLLLIGVTANVAGLGPVRPFIQLPGEVYPGTESWLGGAGFRNTFMASLLAYLILFLLPVFVKAGSRTADEIPTGFYNFFEMIIEGAYNFVKGVTHDKAKDFFPFFMTFIMLVLFANVMGLVPGYDSIGIWEYKPHFYGMKEIKAINTELKAAAAQGDADLQAYVAELESRFAVTVELRDGVLADASKKEILHELEHEFDLQNLGDMRNGPLLVRSANASSDAAIRFVDEENDVKAGLNPQAADWTIVPFVRPAATDLNFNLALALVSMTMVQIAGFRYLGPGYLKKFFVWPKGFVDTFASNPMQGIILILNPVVGLIELISEVSKIISFAFRLLGAMFGGMVLLFVMSSIAPVANLAFFGLELFVGAIQALVFAMLSIIFMNSATVSHHDDHGDHH